MATPTIPNGEEYFFNILYEGNGTGQRVGKFLPFTDSGTIANSCIFNTSDSPDLNRTITTGSQRRIFTISFWVKLGAGGGTLGTNIFYECRQPSNSENFYFGLMDNGKIAFQALNSSGNHVLTQHSNRTFKDTSKWYHLMASVDTTQSTTTDRLKLYVDGDQITSFSYSNYDGGQNYDLPFGNDNSTMYIGQASASSYYMNGYLAEFNIIDGQQLLPASFGVTDTSTGRWIPAQVKPHPTTTTTYTVTVVGGNPSNHPYYNVGSTNKFAINGSTATADVDLTLYEGATYRFDQSDSSNSGHPLRFSTVAHGTNASGGTEYTTNVTVVGTAGTSGAYTEITVASSAPDLHFYCSNHNAMGYQASTPIGYGANGARFTFSDSSSLGADTSGNSNTFTVTNLASTDQTTDSPTQNFNNMGGSDTGGFTKAEGNLKITIPSSGAYEQCVGLSSFGVNSGKWYWEVKIDSKGQSGFGWKSDDNNGGAIAKDTGGNLGTIYVVGTSGGFADGEWTDDYTSGNSNFSPFTTASNNDVIMFALDLDNQKGYVGLNGTWFNSANPANGTGSIGLGYLTTHSPNAKFYPMCLRNDSATTATYNFGATSFAYTPPTGFLKWQQDNLPETAKGVSGFSWIKNRDTASNHQIYDSSRGAGKLLMSSATNAESTRTDALYKFLKGGYAVGDNSSINGSGDSIVAWNWQANGGTTASNGNGSITSTVQANTTAGFSIVQYTGTGSNATVGHGLSSAPEWILFKNLDNASEGWSTYHTSLTSATYILTLNNTNAQASSATDFNSTAPTSTVLSVGTNARTNASGVRYIAYCWHSVEGFSKFGKYTGNGSTDGTFIYTGFQPAMVIVKSSSNSATSWEIRDNKRSSSGGTNPITQVLYPDLNSQEYTTDNCDFLSNGFKWRSSGGNRNESGYTYIYIAFAEHPFVGDGTSPVTAR